MVPNRPGQLSRVPQGARSACQADSGRSPAQKCRLVPERFPLHGITSSVMTSGPVGHEPASRDYQKRRLVPKHFPIQLGRSDDVGPAGHEPTSRGYTNAFYGVKRRLAPGHVPFPSVDMRSSTFWNCGMRAG